MKKNTFKIYIHYLIYLFCAMAFAFSLDMSMTDDGLRHLSFGLNEEVMKSWGDVFPYSLFNEYDPWFMWHKLIFFISLLFDKSHIHIVINCISLFLLMILVDKHLKKSLNYNFDSLLYLVVFSIVYLTASRYLMVRPDLLSGLYILSALLLSKRVLFLFFITLLYGPFYYLFFLYTGSIAFVYLIQKRFKAFYSVVLGSILSLAFYLIYDFENYLYTVKNILLDQQLRMGLEVGEGKPLFDLFGHINYFILLPLFFLFSFFLIYKYYEYFKKNELTLFLLITSILWVNQVRYYLLFLPLFFILGFSFFVNLDKKRAFRNVRKYYILTKKYFSYSKKAKIFYIIAIPYTIFALSFSIGNKSVNKQIEEASFFKQDYFDNKTILLNRLNTDLYKALYYNPSLKFVPSCSVGWFDNQDFEIKDIYIRMQKDNGINELELAKLVKYVNADFYIHYTQNKKQTLNFDKLTKLGIIPKMIYHNRIIFRIDKKNE